MAILDITTYAGPYPSGWGLLDDDAQTINDADTSTLPQARITALKMYETAGAAGGVTDDDAIHDNVAAEISAITEKVTPVSADLLIIEDSAAANVKKKVQVGNLPGGGGATKKCRARPAADLTAINASAGYVVPLDAEDFDVGGWHDNVTNNTRLTVPSDAASKVDLTAIIKIDLHDANQWVIYQIRKDGTTLAGREIESGRTTINDHLTVNDIEVTPGTTYFEIRIVVESDTSITVEQETSLSSRESP